MSSNYEEKLLRIGDDLVGYWPLKEESGTSAIDLSDNAYNATTSALVRVPATRGFTGPDGGRCAQFDGSSSYVDLSTASSSSANAEGTISVWVAVPQANLAGTTKMQVVFLSADTANTIGIDFDTTAYRFSGDYFAGGTYSTTTAPNLIYNVDGGKQEPEWHHLALSYSATNDEAILYVDGAASTAASSLGTWAGAFGSTVTCLGTSKLAGADQFTGWMAHMAWWSSPLSADEVKELAKIGP
jgi:hypothetical protein